MEDGLSELLLDFCCHPEFFCCLVSSLHTSRVWNRLQYCTVDRRQARRRGRKGISISFTLWAKSSVQAAALNASWQGHYKLRPLTQKRHCISQDAICPFASNTCRFLTGDGWKAIDWTESGHLDKYSQWFNQPCKVLGTFVNVETTKNNRKRQMTYYVVTFKIQFNFVCLHVLNMFKMPEK